VELPQHFKYSTDKVGDAEMGVSSVLSSNLGAISTEKILRNDVLKPVSLGLLRQKPSIQTEKNDIESVVEENIRMLDSIRLPTHFERETLANFLEKMIRKDLAKDPLHKQAVELNKYAKDFRTYMRQYFDKIFGFNSRWKEDLLKHVFATSHIYLKSDFPPSFARTLTFSLLTECRFFDIYNMKIRREHLALMTYYNNARKFNRLCDNHNLWVDPLDSAINKMDEMRIGLIWYVDFIHSKTLEEIFEPKVLKKSLLDEEYFFGMLVGLQQQTYRFRQALTNLSKETFAISISRKDPTVDMLCGIMETMGS